MRQKPGPPKDPAEQVVKEIRRAAHRHYSAEERIRIVLAGLRGEDGIAELCRREGIPPNVYFRWSTDFLEAGKKRLADDTAREATSDEVKDVRQMDQSLPWIRLPVFSKSLTTDNLYIEKFKHSR